MKPPRANAMFWYVAVFSALIAWAGTAGCQAEQPAPNAKEKKPMTIKITSSAFADGQPIPKKHTGEGARRLAAAGLVQFARQNPRTGADLRRPRCPDAKTLGSIGSFTRFPPI